MPSKVDVPAVINEPVFSYAPGSPERIEIKAKLQEMASQEIEIPLIIAGEEVRTGDTAQAVMPHDHGHVLATYHRAGKEETERAIAAAIEAHRDWSTWHWEDQVAVFLRAAELLATAWRAPVNASTMLGQSKTVFQAEIDAACELIDFFRFNARFAQQIYEEQPISSRGVWNWIDYRPLEGFVYAVTPFNFTSVGGNLPGAPAIMGNTVVWKPSRTAVFSNYHVMRLFEAAGLPPGVINFVPGHSAAITRAVMSHPAFDGIHFTGSTPVFQDLWLQIAKNLTNYRSYPRIVGETGGKDYILAHPSADPEALVTAIIRGAFEYQGQKCSAASRAYIPEGLWAEIGDDLIDQTEGIAMGDPRDFRNFMGAVIDKPAFDDISLYIEDARASADAEILAGGEADDSVGFFIRPTLIRALKADYVTMCEEIFGPVLTLYIYPDDQWDETVRLVDQTSPYGLTGAVFSQNRSTINHAIDDLRYSAGNFYINDKPTGAVVGQQPFGGSRASGTNDKAGSKQNLLRWLTIRSVKENLAPPTDYEYPFMNEE
jgi:1-pyrroline-5-carboxylate dehydrogenase